MRYPFLFGAMLVVLALAACGGSSSETPPPLQPDPAGFRYAPTYSRPVVDEADAGAAEGVPDPNAKPRAPAGAPSGSAPPPR